MGHAQYSGSADMSYPHAYAEHVSFHAAIFSREGHCRQESGSQKEK